MSDKGIQVAATDESNGPGTGGQRLSVSVWVRFPGGPWLATSERSRVKVARILASIGLCPVLVNRDIDLLEEIRGRLKS